ncbi:MAG: ferritin [Gammaproteobacteria bacterium]|nr:ferritin [Gammaproteobacteria bacterium]
MINEKMVAALNEQINYEIYSAHIYLAMSSNFSSKNLPGFANWMRIQYEEELMHAMKIFDYVINRDGKSVIATIPQPAASWDSPIAAFSDALEHEQKVTARIYDLVNLASELKDHATYSFLQWFVDEQVEEEAQTAEIIGQLDLVKDHSASLLMLDKELRGRTLNEQPSSN